MIYYRSNVDNVLRLQNKSFGMNWYGNFSYTGLGDRVDRISPSWKSIGPTILVEWMEE